MRAKPGMYTLKNRKQFLAVSAYGLKKPMPGLVLQAAPDDGEGIGFGLTVSKRCGGAVERNRIKRRLRRVAGEILTINGRAGCQYVIIGRAAARDRAFEALKEDLQTALKTLHKRLDEKA